MTSPNRSFGQILLESIDEGLSVLGGEPQQAVYQFLQTICSLPREEIPQRIPEFAAGLRRAIGSASRVMERMILRKLFEKTGSTFKEIADSEFTDYVEDAKRRFEILSHRGEDSLTGSKSKKGQISG
ncbi:MAG TPA: hypothetical protein VFJ63_05060 [Candidatus Bathyarchaeia archaeon]|nr:hypothetical protein [Candidatus Bathyarchaeia archaeon]